MRACFVPEYESNSANMRMQRSIASFSVALNASRDAKSIASIFA
jgi:hypothetical protein